MTIISDPDYEIVSSGEGQEKGGKQASVRKDQEEFQGTMTPGLDVIARTGVKRELKSLNHRHHKIMDLLLYYPDMQYQEIAKEVGVSSTWVSLVIYTDLFQEELRKRRAQVEEFNRETLKARLYKSASKGLDRMDAIMDDEDASDSVAVAANKNILTALGFMNTNGGGVNISVNETNNVQNNLGVTPEMLAKAKDRRS